MDGGSALPQEFSGYTNRTPAAAYLREAGIQKIDLLVISHIHEDHVCGLEEVLSSVSVGELLLPVSADIFDPERTLTPSGNAPPSAYLFSDAVNAMARLVKTAKTGGIPIKTLRCGDEVPFPGGELLALAPGPESLACFEALLREAYEAADPTEALVRLDRASNDSSLLLRLRCGGVDTLLTGDSCPGNWDGVDFSLLENVTVLKLPHHGQKDSVDEKLMAKMPLSVIVTTSASDRRYQSANPAVYDRLRALHPRARLLFTDERAYPPYFSNPDGGQAVKLVIDSSQIRVEFIKIEQGKRGENL